jgi:hypothetical protein
MGEASQKRKSNEALLKDNPFCIFCGGTELATTIEHCPPRMMFRGKRRPHELGRVLIKRAAMSAFGG